MTSSAPESEPEFGGACAFGTALMGAGKAPAGKPEHALTVDGKTYHFSGGLQKRLAAMFPGLLARAQRRWAEKH